jgi:hypothetical protein
VEKQKPAIIAQTKDNAAFQAALFEGFFGSIDWLRQRFNTGPTGRK